MKRILFQGDSITDADRSREDNRNVGRGYPVLISAELGYENPGEYEFLNRGVSGSNVVGLYEKSKKDIINLKPDVISVLIGVNDVWHEIDEQNGVDEEKFYKIYSMLIEEVKEALPDVKIIILEPFVLKGEATASHWEYFCRETKKRAAKAKMIAEKYNLSFVSLQEKFNEAEKRAVSQYWLFDGVHPTSAGHELIKREWIKVFNAFN